MTKAQTLKSMTRLMKAIEKVNDAFNEAGNCSGISCGECPFNMEDKKLHFHLTGSETGCAYAALSSITRAAIANTRKVD